MRNFVPTLGIAAAACIAAACGTVAGDEDGGTARVTIADRTFEVENVQLFFEPGEDGFFRVEGQDPALPEQDCLPGLPGGLALYGDLPASVVTLAGLAGQELPFEFSGDGDDANLCFVGSNGLFGVESGTVRFTAVDGSKVSFTFSGSFAQYDGEGGREPLLQTASGSGIAHLMTY